jgi:hypothetical protein
LINIYYQFKFILLYSFEKKSGRWEIVIVATVKRSGAKNGKFATIAQQNIVNSANGANCTNDTEMVKLNVNTPALALCCR